ncbi:MAG: acetyltransferase [Acidimicrobiales bacterium]|nr:acetyltransferase [Acidimicrobiales bacterium]
MSDRLVIVGAGGHGREALAIAREINRLTDNWHEILFVDDGETDADLLDRVDAEVIGGLAELRVNGDDHVLAIGDPGVRRRLDAEIDGDAPAIPLVSLDAWIGDDVHLDDGVMIHPGVTCTTNVRIGRHSHLNCGAVVSHDCRIGDYVSVSPGVLLNGAVTVEDDAFLGTGAIVLPGRRIGQGAVVGAGAVVVDDVAAGATVVGVPAR